MLRVGALVSDRRRGIREEAPVVAVRAHGCEDSFRARGILGCVAGSADIVEELRGLVEDVGVEEAEEGVSV